MPNDLAKLQGSWTLRSLELDGQEMPAMGGVEIAGDRFTAVGMGHDYAGTVEIDASARPKHFDLVFTEGPEKGNRNRGIYELKGDTWKICLNMLGKQRPRSFTAKPGSGNALEVFTRGPAPVDGPPPVEAPAGEGERGAEPSRDREGAVVAGEGELIGEWEMVNAWQGGEAIDARMIKSARRVTTATHTTTYFGKQIFLNAEYTTDPTQSPKTIDLIAKGATQLGIYELTGDTLKICFASPGKPRPTNYDTAHGDGRTSAVWRRSHA